MLALELAEIDYLLEWPSTSSVLRVVDDVPPSGDVYDRLVLLTMERLFD